MSEGLTGIPQVIKSMIEKISAIPINTSVGDMTNLDDANYLTKKVAECNEYLNRLDNHSSDLAMMKLAISQQASARKLDLRARKRALLEQEAIQAIESPSHREARIRELTQTDVDYLEDAQTYLRDLADIETIVRTKSGSYKRLVSILKTKLNSISRPTYHSPNRG